MIDDPRIKEYFDYLWAMYRVAVKKSGAYTSENDTVFYAGEAQGLSEAIEILKSVFGLAEYADTPQPPESHGK